MSGYEKIHFLSEEQGRHRSGMQMLSQKEVDSTTYLGVPKDGGVLWVARQVELQGQGESQGGSTMRPSTKQQTTRLCGSLNNNAAGICLDVEKTSKGRKGPM
jgi:hypothetical protein